VPGEDSAKREVGGGGWALMNIWGGWILAKSQRERRQASWKGTKTTESGRRRVVNHQSEGGRKSARGGKTKQTKWTRVSRQKV